MILNVDKVTKSFGTRVLFSNVSFRINERDRYALVGPNGAGKTTLMNIIAGLESADEGQVVFSRDAHPGYLEQESIEMEGRSVLEEVMTSVADVAEMGRRLEALEREMESADESRADDLLAEYGRLRTRFEARDGYNIESQARRVLFGLGFHEEDMERSTDEFSGGWQMRIALSKLLVRNPEVLESLCSDGRNPRYLNDLEFDRNSIAPSSDLDAVVRDADIVILATPSAYLKDFLAPLTVPLRDKFVVSAIKGIVPGDYQTVVEYIHDHYGLSYRQIGLVTGPSHAEEVSRGKLSYLTVVCADPENARRIGERFAGENIRLSYSADLYGVEYAAILKNIYALSVGIAVGLGYGDNFLAVLIANAAGEMTRFLEESYPDARNTQVSAYLGDLLVTCYSTYSRNRRLGLLIGHGCTVKSALNEMTMVAEGYFAADCIRHINFRHRVDMPIADMVYRVLYEGASARRCMQELTTKLI